MKENITFLKKCLNELIYFIDKSDLSLCKKHNFMKDLFYMTKNINLFNETQVRSCIRLISESFIDTKMPFEKQEYLDYLLRCIYDSI